ncbi:MAG: tetratricopeptide repeat protein [Alteromonadaceae bacterium]|nr:tetratricopeptide repeat protein [Alteromonadaceae bacterium]
MSEINQINQALRAGDFASVLSQTNQLLQQKNIAKEVERQLLYFKVVALRLSKQLEASLNIAIQLTTLDTNYGRAFQELGYIYKGLGKTKESAEAFYQAVQKNQALVSSWRELITLYKQQKQDDALSLANAQLRYLKALPKALLGARDLMYEGDLVKADNVCRQFLQHNKHHEEGLFLLAEIGIARKQYAEAEFILQSCVELYPAHLGANTVYLSLLSKMGKFKHALQLSEKLLVLHPDNKQITVAKATSLVGVGKVEEAIDLYTKLLQQENEQPALHLLLAHALKAKGNIEQAISEYQTAYSQHPEFGDAYWSLANTKTYRFTDAEMTSMQNLVKTQIATEDEIHMLFALGKAFEDKKQYDQSFAYYQKGNSLKHSTTGYQAEFIERQVEQQLQYFDETLSSKFKNVGYQAIDPIFIVGLPRSGSTLLEQILASHSKVDGTMELHNILGLVSRLHAGNRQYPKLLSELDDSYYARFGEQYIQETKTYRESAPLFIDKMPNNFVHIGLIKLILPNAKIIDARRHHMACGFSCYKQLFGEGQEFTYDLETFSRYYQAYLRVMQHWDDLFPGHILKVQHEDVVNDLEGQVKRLLDFCDLEFEQNCIHFYETERTIKTPSSEQVRQPIYRGGLEQWKNYEQHLTPLTKITLP